jgi:hypothetical protein
MKKNIVGLIGIVISLLLIIQPSAAVVTPYWDNPVGFNAAAGTLPGLINFELNPPIPPNMNIDGVMINGVTFFPVPPTGAPLFVREDAALSSILPDIAPIPYIYGDSKGIIPPAELQSNRLYATTPHNVLSPGADFFTPADEMLVPGDGTGLPGPFDIFENDDMMLVFNPPVGAVGFDLLFQSLDGDSLVDISIFDSSDNLLASYPSVPTPWLPPIAPSRASPGGSSFVGFVSDSNNIARIVIDERDSNNEWPDNNIGMDTLIFGPLIPISCGDGTCNGAETCESCPSDCGACPAVPEFPSLALPVTMIIGFLGTVLFIQRTKQQ